MEIKSLDVIGYPRYYITSEGKVYNNKDVLKKEVNGYVRLRYGASGAESRKVKVQTLMTVLFHQGE